MRTALRELESAMASETEAAAGNTIINYEAASTAVEMPVVVMAAAVMHRSARRRQQWQRLRWQRQRC